MLRKLILILLNLLPVVVYCQDIQSDAPVILPLTGQSVYQVSSGQTVKIASKQYVLLNPGTTLASGSTVIIGITNPLTVAPAPANPAADFDKNWVLARAYDEDGNEISATKGFFDNNGTSTQTQSKNETAGHVLATQTLYDQQQRASLSTLAAPINNSEFAYKTNFITSGSVAYSYLNFDGTAYNKLNNPDPVGNAQIGTLGWYFSDNNSFEGLVPVTEYPYSRSDFFRDGTGRAKRSSGIGEQLKMGMGHEVTSFSSPVINELNHYLTVRNKFFPSSVVGETRTSMSGLALQTVTTDADKQQAVSITDLSGKLLVTGRADPQGYLSITNTATITNIKGVYSFAINTTGSQLPDNISRFTIKSPYTVLVTCAGCSTPVYNNIGDNFKFPVNGTDKNYTITSDYPFVITASAGSTVPVTVYDQVISKFTEPATPSFHYFQLTSQSPVTLTGDYSILNMQSEVAATFTNGTLPPGYYKVIATKPTSLNTTNTVTVTYTNKYSDLSYNFYNQLGQPLGNIAPNGIKALVNSGLNAFNTINDVPFLNRNEYDLQGRLTASTTTDGGKTEYIYRTDGKIRFSQNASQRVQANAGSGNLEKYSYTHYDRWGRPMESGEYVIPTASTLTFQSLKTNTTVLESTSNSGGLSGGTELDAVNTKYDEPSSGIALEGYVQDEGFLRGAVSVVSNANSTTYYNYDDQGRVTWLVKQIAGISTKKTINYTYNAQGNVTMVDYQRDTPAERFIHYYDYDADGRLVNVRTSRDDVTLMQQAKYYYYLHGPLKRVELGENLQGIDYVYTTDGKLKSINHSSGDPLKDPGKDGITGSSFLTDAFSMQMEYHPDDYTRANSNITSIATGEATYYSGNVNGISWQSKKPSSLMSDPLNAGLQDPTMYTYNYNSRYELTNAFWGTPNFGTNSFVKSPDNRFQEFNLTYDPNGNIKTLQRRNSTGGFTNSNNFNNYQYQENTNKLYAVGSTTTPGSYATYTYDELGQLKTQTKDGLTSYIKYDVTGKITGVYSDELMTTALVLYKYDEAGNRVKVSVTNSGGVSHTYYIYDASGNVMATYTGSTGANFGEVPVYGSDRLGMYRVSDGRYVYEMRDNVGSVKVVINRNRTSGGLLDVIQYNDYYPFGSIARQGGDGYKYEYQGAYAEKDAKTGWSNFDLRMYDGKIGRWLSVDPVGQFYSPYNGMGNNPVSASDPTGGVVNDYEQQSDGSIKLVNVTKDNFDVLYAPGTQVINGETSGIIVSTVNKGFLHDGLDLENKDTFIKVGSKDDMDSYMKFILDYSMFRDKEIAGFFVDKMGFNLDQLTDILIPAIKGNDFETSYNIRKFMDRKGYIAYTKTVIVNNNVARLRMLFHTHPARNRVGYGYSTPSEGDIRVSGLFNLPGTVLGSRGSSSIYDKFGIIKYIKDKQ